jgi:hypothetical protein
MTPNTRLLFASIFFAVFWTAAMYWLQAPQGVAAVAILMISGAIVGTLWFFAMRWWMTKFMRRS